MNKICTFICNNFRQTMSGSLKVQDPSPADYVPSLV